MHPIAIAFQQVWKKYRKGPTHDSLREMVPELARRLVRFRGQGKDVLREKEFWAVEDVSFEIKRGESLGIIGPNGSGKSTLLKLLSRILVPTRGAITVRGRLSALIEVGAGFHGDLTGRENIYLNGAILGMKKREIDRRLDEIIAFSEVESFIDTPVKRYSSGMYARLGFSVAAHMDPEILLIDEVLSVGDAGFRAKCLAKLQETLHSGASIIFVSHNVREVARLCERVLVLVDGQARHLGDAVDAMKVYHDATVGRSRMTDAPARFSSPCTVTVRSVDASGDEVPSIPFGGVVRFRAQCHLPKEMETAHLIIRIGNYTDQDYVVLSSERAGITLSPGSADVLCHLEPCRLLPGRYRIRAGLRHPLTQRPLELFPYQPDLLISPPDNALAYRLPSSQNAIIDIPCAWQVKGELT